MKTESYLFATNADETARSYLLKAAQGIGDLEAWLEQMLQAMCRDNHTSGFSVDWCLTMMEKAMHIYNEVAKANGAITVRGTPRTPSRKKKPACLKS